MSSGQVNNVGHFRGKLEGFRSRWKVSLRDVRSALGYSAGDVLQCLCGMIAFAVICLFSVHRFGEASFQVMSVLFQYIALTLFFMGVTEGFLFGESFSSSQDDCDDLVEVALPHNAPYSFSLHPDYKNFDFTSDLRWLF